MPLAQSSELPPPKPMMASTSEAGGVGAAGLDHVAVGVLAELVKREGGEAGLLQRSHGGGDGAGRDEAGIGDEQDAGEPEIAGEGAEPRRGARGEDDASTGVKFERDQLK